MKTSKSNIMLRNFYKTMRKRYTEIRNRNKQENRDVFCLLRSTCYQLFSQLLYPNFHFPKPLSFLHRSIHLFTATCYLSMFDNQQVCISLKKTNQHLQDSIYKLFTYQAPLEQNRRQQNERTECDQAQVPGLQPPLLPGLCAARHLLTRSLSPRVQNLTKPIQDQSVR